MVIVQKVMFQLFVILEFKNEVVELKHISAVLCVCCS